MLPFPFSRFPAFSLFALFFLCVLALHLLYVLRFTVSHVAPPGLLLGGDTTFYKHVAPLGLNASVPVFSFSRLLSFRSLFSLRPCVTPSLRITF